MPRRRRLGNAMGGVSDTLNQIVGMILQNNMVTKRQTEAQTLARKHATDQAHLQSTLNQQDQLHGELVKNPAYANRAGGMTSTERAGPVRRRLSEAKTPSELPTMEDTVGLLGEQGTIGEQHLPLKVKGEGDVPSQLGDLLGLLGQRDAKETELDALAPRTAVNYTGEDGIDRTGFYSDEEKGTLGSLQAGPTPEQKAERDRLSSKGQRQGTLDAENDPANVAGSARREGAITGARKQSELDVEYNPANVQKKLDLLSRENAIKLQHAGNTKAAELVAESRAAMVRAMPLYSQYRNLAKSFKESWAASDSVTTEAVAAVLAKLPYIGEATAEGANALQAALAEIKDPTVAKQIVELNRVTQGLSLMMANAVMGNKGQTTENDRRAAASILVSGFTHPDLVDKRLQVTDELFALMPSVAGEAFAKNPNATGADILAEIERRGAVQKTAGDPTLSPVAQSAGEKWKSRTRGN